MKTLNATQMAAISGGEKPWLNRRTARFLCRAISHIGQFGDRALRVCDALFGD